MELCALLNCQISQRATVPVHYFLVFLTLPAWRNSFWGALPPIVAQTFLLADPSLPNVDGLASAPIWANCQVGNDEGDLPTPSSCPTSAILLIISFACGGTFSAGVGGAPATRASSPFTPLLWLPLSVVSWFWHPSSPTRGLPWF